MPDRGGAELPAGSGGTIAHGENGWRAVRARGAGVPDVRAVDVLIETAPRGSRRRVGVRGVCTPLAAAVMEGRSAARSRAALHAVPFGRGRAHRSRLAIAGTPVPPPGAPSTASDRVQPLAPPSGHVDRPRPGTLMLSAYARAARERPLWVPRPRATTALPVRGTHGAVGARGSSTLR